jgi:hypothetical protein
MSRIGEVPMQFWNLSHSMPHPLAASPTIQ